MNTPYKDYKLLVLMIFQGTTVTSMDSQEPACCDDGHLLAWCKHATYLIRQVLEALNLTEDGTNCTASLCS